MSDNDKWNSPIGLLVEGIGDDAIIIDDPFNPENIGKRYGDRIKSEGARWLEERRAQRAAKRKADSGDIDYKD